MNNNSSNNNSSNNKNRKTTNKINKLLKSSPRTNQKIQQGKQILLFPNDSDYG